MATPGEVRILRRVGPVGIDSETRDHDVPVVRFEAEVSLNGTEDLEPMVVDMPDGSKRVVVVAVLTVTEAEWDTEVAAIRERGALGPLAAHLDSTGLRPALARHCDRQG